MDQPSLLNPLDAFNPAYSILELKLLLPNNNHLVGTEIQPHSTANLARPISKSGTVHFSIDIPNINRSSRQRISLDRMHTAPRVIRPEPAAGPDIAVRPSSTVVACARKVVPHALVDDFLSDILPSLASFIMTECT